MNRDDIDTPSNPYYGAEYSLPSNWREHNLEWLLIPQHIGLLLGPLTPPPVAAGRQLKIEVQQQLRKNEAHLKIGKVAAYAVAWANGERIEGFGVVS